LIKLLVVMAASTVPAARLLAAPWHRMWMTAIIFTAAVRPLIVQPLLIMAAGDVPTGHDI